jgi:LmbE family N-acetylglucosaminyl deacetylase
MRAGFPPRSELVQGLRLRLGIEGAHEPVEPALEGVRRATIVFAHMDDEINACGLLSRLAAAGAQLDLVVLTDGAANPWTDERVVGARTHFECRRDELLQSMQALGIAHVELPQFPDGQLANHLTQAVDLLSAHLRAVQPDLVITFEPSGLNGHRDHCATQRATRRALLTNEQSIALALLTPPPPFSYVLGSRFRSAGPVCVRTLTLTRDEVQRKARLCELYASQARTLKMMMLGLPAATFFQLFSKEWYLWLPRAQTRAWLEASRA